MKTNLLKGTMGGRMLLICTIALPLCFSACKKDNDTNNNTVMVEEAGTAMAQAVDPETGGIVLQTEASANFALAANNPAWCGIRRDTTVAGQFSGTNRSFNYSLSLSRLLTCTGNVPAKYEHSFTGSAAYSVPAMSSTGNATGSFTLTGLEAGSSQLSLDQTYTYSGTQQSKVGAMRTLVSNVTIHSTGVKVDKTTRQIVSGTATINITGTVSTGETFNYDGLITFLGGKKATLAVSGGNSFDITW